MEWIFQSREKTADRVDVSPLAPSRLASISIDEVLELKLAIFGSSTMAKVRDLFEFQWNSGQASAEESHQVVFRGDGAYLDRIGAEMDGGVILVEGSAGDQVGYGMRAGTIIVGGDCGDELCCAMRDGQVLVRGSAGDRVAGPAPGAKSGMRGGDCIVACSRILELSAFAFYEDYSAGQLRRVGTGLHRQNPARPLVPPSTGRSELRRSR